MNKGGGGSDPQTALRLAIGCHTPPGGGIAPGNGGGGGFVGSFTEAEIDEKCDEKFGAGRQRVNPKRKSKK